MFPIDVELMVVYAQPGDRTVFRLYTDVDDSMYDKLLLFRFLHPPILYLSFYSMKFRYKASESFVFDLGQGRFT